MAELWGALNEIILVLSLGLSYSDSKLYVIFPDAYTDGGTYG